MSSGLIGAAGSILGGLLGAGAEERAIKAQNAYNDPSAIRARAEAAGFNPLLFIGPGVGQQTAVGGSNFMGSAIADASAMLADGLATSMAKKPSMVQLDEIKAQNAKLQAQVSNMTLRPKVGGVYSRSTPTLRSALGFPDVKTSSSVVSSASAVRPRMGLSFGGVVPVVDSVSDAGDFEQRWGEVGGSAAGLGVMAVDLLSAVVNSPANKNAWTKLTGEQVPPPVDLRRHIPISHGGIGRKIPNTPPLDVMGFDKYGDEWPDMSPLSLQPFVDRIRPLPQKSLPSDYWTLGAFRRSLPHFQLGR
jgi:hypothetical protein